MTHIASDGSNQSPLVATGTPVPGTDAQTYTAADVGARPSSYVPAWSEVTSKPTTFPPTIGTTATPAKAGNYVPAWSEITGKPTVRGTIGPAIPAIYAWFLADQTVVSGTITTLTWTNSAHDPFSMLSNGEFVVPSWAAYARVTASIQFSTNATGYRYVGYARNGVVQAATRQQPVAGDPSTVQLISPIRTMAAGSVLSLRVWQNSGATLTVNPQSWVQIELYEAQ